MTNDHTSPVEESAGLTISPLELMLMADAANLQAQPIGIQMADGICHALFSPRVSRRMPDYPVCDECNERHSLDVTCEDVTERRMNDASPAVAEEAANVMGQLASIFPKPVDPNSIEGFDYKHQAWVVRGRYQRCGHPALMACGCYGRRHQGERPACDAEIH